MGQETGAESQLLTGAEAMLLWDRKTGGQYQVDLGKVGLLNCNGSDDRGRAVKVTMINTGLLCQAGCRGDGSLPNGKPWL